MEIGNDIIGRNQYKPPCKCPYWIKMREPGPYCNHPKSPYYLRRPGGPCKYAPLACPACSHIIQFDEHWERNVCQDCGYRLNNKKVMPQKKTAEPRGTDYEQPNT